MLHSKGEETDLEDLTYLGMIIQSVKDNTICVPWVLLTQMFFFLLYHDDFH